MNLYDALRVEGTNHYQLLLYLVFPVDCVTTALEVCRSRFVRDGVELTRLSDKTWRHDVVLIEMLLQDTGVIPRQLIECLHAALDVQSCLAAVCMFDGAFGCYDDLFSKKLAEQTFGFCTAPGEANVCLAEQVRASEEWREIVSRPRKLIAE